MLPNTWFYTIWIGLKIWLSESYDREIYNLIPILHYTICKHVDGERACVVHCIRDTLYYVLCVTASPPFRPIKYSQFEIHLSKFRLYYEIMMMMPRIMMIVFWFKFDGEKRFGGRPALYGCYWEQWWLYGNNDKVCAATLFNGKIAVSTLVFAWVLISSRWDRMAAHPNPHI